MSVLLAKRMGEADYDGIYSFIGGKMETTDQSMIDGMKREKNEEIGSGAVVKLLPNESYNLLFRKKDGNSMILPHIAGIFVSGDISINDEYSEYKWVEVTNLAHFSPLIEGIPELTQWAINKLDSANEKDFVEV